MERSVNNLQYTIEKDWLLYSNIITMNETSSNLRQLSETSDLKNYLIKLDFFIMFRRLSI